MPAHVLNMNDTTSRKRQPRGTTVGGQFATQARLESGVSLGSAPTYTPIDERVVPIAIWKWEEAEKAIAAANVRLERSGIDHRFEYEWRNERGVDIGSGHYPVKDLHISSPQIKFNGWGLRATLQNVDGGQTFLIRSSGDSIDSSSAPQSMVCDHCGTTRDRNNTYIMEHESGERVQLGSSCMEAYTGISPEGLWAMDWRVPDTMRLEDDSEGDEFKVGREYLGGEPRHLIALALSASDGGKSFVTQTSADYSNATSTADVVRGILDGEAYEVAQAAHSWDQREIDDVIEYARGLESSGEYGRNVSVLVGAGTVSGRHLSTLVSVIAGWRKHKDTQSAAGWDIPAQPEQGWIGTVGEKIEPDDFVVMSARNVRKEFRGRKTQSTMVTARLRGTNHQVSFALPGLDAIEAGKRGRMASAKVKYQGFKGDFNTELNYVKIQEIED